MLPSTDTIRRQLKEILGKEYNDISLPVKQIREAMESATTDKKIDIALDTCNAILHGYGVEAIRDNQWENGYYMDIGLLYVNMGDTYIPTVVYDTRKKQWYVTSWGNIIERNEKRFSL